MRSRRRLHRRKVRQGIAWRQRTYRSGVIEMVVKAETGRIQLVKQIVGAVFFSVVVQRDGAFVESRNRCAAIVPCFTSGYLLLNHSMTCSLVTIWARDNPRSSTMSRIKTRTGLSYNGMAVESLLLEERPLEDVRPVVIQIGVLLSREIPNSYASIDAPRIE
jgi:hypothetical protein